MKKYNYSSISSAECVGSGHPDKICDAIADSILTKCLKQDPKARVACEVMASNRLILIGGEVTTSGYVDVVKTAWDKLLALGYNENDFTIISNLNKQSEDIAQAVDEDSNKKHELGAGDQGIVYGYACDETDKYLPLSYVLATELVAKAEQLIKDNQLEWAKYDMKSLVSLKYNKGKPFLESVIFSIQHIEQIKNSKIKKQIKELVFQPILETKYQLNKTYQDLINTSGKFIIGGPIADTGLTNRKLMVDSYGGLALHGGGGFSGKDPSKVDRTGAYLARWIAKNLVAAKICEWAEVKLVYALGQSKPVNISLKFNEDCFYSEACLVEAIEKCFPLKLNEVINELDLLNVDYDKLSCHGHFGRTDLNVKWEETNKVDCLLKNLKKVK